MACAPEVSSPTAEKIEHWSQAALEVHHPNTEICVRIIDEAEMVELNGCYRQKFKPTNVLSFPAELPDHVDINLLGDIAICAPVVEAEAAEQHKDPVAHWAHIVIHGCLHLAGHDHIDEAEAVIMESLEIDLLKKLGYANPYIIPDEKPAQPATAGCAKLSN